MKGEAKVVTFNLRQAIGAIDLTTAVFTGLLAIVFSQSFQGRRAVVDALRRNCVRSAQNSAALINEARAHVIGNAAISADPRQPKLTRDARAREARAGLETISVLVSHMDVGSVALLKNGADRQADLKMGFRCRAAFPAPNPITG